MARGVDFRGSMETVPKLPQIRLGILSDMSLPYCSPQKGVPSANDYKGIGTCDLFLILSLSQELGASHLSIRGPQLHVQPRWTEAISAKTEKDSEGRGGKRELTVSSCSNMCSCQSLNEAGDK